MARTESHARAYMLVCPVPGCCRRQTRHATWQRVDECIKKFSPSVKRLSADEQRAYEDRLKLWDEKIGRGRQRGKMRQVASEPVDWWKDPDGVSLPGVRFGEYVPERSKRQRRADDDRPFEHSEMGYQDHGDDYVDCGDYGDSRGSDGGDSPGTTGAVETAAGQVPPVVCINGSNKSFMDSLFDRVINGTRNIEEALGSISGPMLKYARHERFSTLRYGMEAAIQQINGMVKMLEKNVSVTTGTDIIKTTMASTTEGDDGLNLESLIKKIRAPYRTLYSCKYGHDVHEEARTTCEHCDTVHGQPKMCGERRVVASYHFSLEQWLKHYMRDPKFAHHVRDGPEELAREQDDPDALSLWKGQAMSELGRWVDLSLDNHIPVVIEMFIDGFEPTESSRSVWAVIVRVLNLPGDIANDYLFPLCFMDGKSIDGEAKPESIDASLAVSVEELQSFYRHRPGPGKYLEPAGAIDAYDVSKGAQVPLRVFLHSVSCDMKAMQYVAKHAMVPGKWVCHRCSIEGTVLKTPGASGRGRHSTVYTTIDRATGDSQWELKNNEEARLECRKADVYAVHDTHSSLLKGYLGTPVFAALPYFDIVDSFLVCAMHQVHNVVVRCLSKSLGLSGWTGDIIHMFINDERVLGWGGTGKEWMRESDLPWAGLDGPIEGEWTQEELQKLTLIELKDLLAQFRLQKTGNKPDLVERLMAHQTSQAPAAQQDPSDGHDDVLASYMETQAEQDVSDDDDDAGEGSDEVAADPEPDADVENVDGLGTLLHDGIKRSVFSKAWWNAFGSMLPWPHKARVLRPGERSLRQAYVFAKSVVPCSAVNGNVVDVLHPKTSKKPGVKSWFRKVKMSENKDHAITMLIPVMMCLGGVHHTIVKAWADLFWGLRILCSYHPRRSDVLKVQEEWPSVFRQLERKLFPTDRAAALHALFHLPAQVLRLGDLWRTSSYAFESYLGPCKVISKLNRRMPVQTLVRRLAALMSLQDLRSLLGWQMPQNTTHTKGHLVYDAQGEVEGCVGMTVSPTCVVPGMKTNETGHRLIHLIAAFYASYPRADARVQLCVDRYDLQLEEFKALDLPYRVCIQDERSRRTATNNSLVVLARGAGPQAESAADSASDAQPPDLGQVVRIYRIRVGSGDIPVETRTLLLVRRCILHHVDQELERCGLKGRVWAHYKPRPTKLELVDLHSVKDQAFTGDDPRKPAGKGEYYEQFVFTKGKTGGDRLVAQTSR